MKGMPDKAVDLVLTDPPYGKKADKGSSGFGVKEGRTYSDDWDYARPSKEYFDQLLRIGKDVIIFGGNYFADLLPASNCWIVWDKKGAYRFNNPFADCELAWTTFTRPVKKYQMIQQGFVSDTTDERLHPTQKPTELFKAIITDFSPTGLVCDPFLGSGTTAVAAKALGRNFIGIEKEKKYCEIAETRLSAVQVALF